MYIDDDYEDDYYDDDYPCDSCGMSEHCDGWDASVCSLLNNYLGINDYDPYDV